MLQASPPAQCVGHLGNGMLDRIARICQALGEFDDRRFLHNSSQFAEWLPRNSQREMLAAWLQRRK
jgi:hypothetical protein